MNGSTCHASYSVDDWWSARVKLLDEVIVIGFVGQVLNDVWHGEGGNLCGCHCAPMRPSRFIGLTRHDARLTARPSSTTMPLIPPLDASMLSREPWAYWLPDYNHIRVMRQVDTVVVAWHDGRKRRLGALVRAPPFLSFSWTLPPPPPPGTASTTTLL